MTSAAGRCPHLPAPEWAPWCGLGPEHGLDANRMRLYDPDLSRLEHPPDPEGRAAPELNETRSMSRLQVAIAIVEKI